VVNFSTLQLILKKHILLLSISPVYSFKTVCYSIYYSLGIVLIVKDYGQKQMIHKPLSFRDLYSNSEEVN
jgi:hypothetical protein